MAQQDQIFIQHRFTINEGSKQYKDAIVLPLSEYQQLSPEQIESKKNERFNSWKTISSTPQVVVSDPEAELQTIDAQIQELSSKKQQLEFVIQEKIQLEHPVEETIKGK
jgi:hypothetical protein